MKILLIYDNSGPKYHRCILPIVYMPGVEFVNSQILTEELCDGIDILFFNRIITNHTIESVLRLRDKYGFKIVVDFDDDWHLTPDHYLYNIYQETKASEIMQQWVVESDAVTVTHDRLAQKVYPLNKNVHVLPNAIPKEGQFLAKKIPSDVTRLFWAGGVTHAKDIELLRGPVQRFSGLPVQMVMGGYSKNSTEHQRMASAYTNGGKLPHDLIESLPVNDYYYAYSKCDIALIPLKDTVFNQNKSNLKILEAANVGANVIVSNVHPYKDFPHVNYVDTASDWFKWVKWLLGNKEAAIEQSILLQNYVDETFNFGKINKKRYEIFESLCNHTTNPASKVSETSTTPG